MWPRPGMLADIVCGSGMGGGMGGGMVTLFHGTNGEHAGSIGKRGLVPSKDGRLGPGVYLTPDEDAAWRWAEHFRDHGKPCVFTCKVPTHKIMRRAQHPGYPPDIPAFPEVLVSDPQSVEIIHITGWVDHALEQKKKPTMCVVDHNNPNETAGRVTQQCHLRAVYKGKGNQVRTGFHTVKCSKCTRPLAPSGEWVCKTCGKCENCQPRGPDPSLNRTELLALGLPENLIPPSAQPAPPPPPTADELERRAAEQEKREAELVRREAELAKREANLASPGAEDASIQAAIQASLAESTPGAADVTAKSVAQAQPGDTINNCIVIDDDDAESDEVPGAKRARTDAPTM